MGARNMGQRNRKAPQKKNGNKKTEYGNLQWPTIKSVTTSYVWHIMRKDISKFVKVCFGC